MLAATAVAGCAGDEPTDGWDPDGIVAMTRTIGERNHHNLTLERLVGEADGSGFPGHWRATFAGQDLHGTWHQLEVTLDDGKLEALPMDPGSEPMPCRDRNFVDFPHPSEVLELALTVPAFAEASQRMDSPRITYVYGADDRNCLDGHASLHRYDRLKVQSGAETEGEPQRWGSVDVYFDPETGIKDITASSFLFRAGGSGRETRPVGSTTIASSYPIPVAIAGGMLELTVIHSVGSLWRDTYAIRLTDPAGKEWAGAVRDHVTEFAAPDAQPGNWTLDLEAMAPHVLQDDFSWSFTHTVPFTVPP